MPVESRSSQIFLFRRRDKPIELCSEPSFVAAPEEKIWWGFVSTDMALLTKLGA